MAWVTCVGATTGQDVSLRELQLSQGFRIFGASAGDNLGNSVSAAGDVNGDGVADVIVGAFSKDGEAGMTYVIFGQRSRASDVFLSSMVTGRYTGFRIRGAATGDRSGISVGSAGDVNGDGIGDIVVGAALADPTTLEVSDEPGRSASA